MAHSIRRHASLRMATKKSIQENIDPHSIVSSVSTRSTNLNTNKTHQNNNRTPHKHNNLTPTRSHSSLLDSPNTANIINNKTLTKLQHSASDSNLNLSINDCTCPICLEILIEPVKMPCTHELCLPCFKAMTDKTNFLCPMCRMRISTWSRSAANTNTLVDAVRWAQIKAAFPREVRIRLEGKTALYLEQEMKEQDSLKKQHQHVVQCSKPGEIGKEYQECLRREEERIRLEKENEEKLSSQLIKQVIQEEEKLSVNEYLQVLNSASSSSTRRASSTSANAASNMINYFNRIQAQQSPLEQQHQQRKATSLTRSNTIHQASSTSSASSFTSSEIRTNLLKKRTLNNINASISEQAETTSQPVSAMHNLRLSHNNTNLTPAATAIASLSLEKTSQTITSQNKAESVAAAALNGGEVATSPNASIAKSVKLRPRQSIKRTRDLPASVANLRANSRHNNHAESNMNDSIISINSINPTTTTIKNLRRRKINVTDHDHENDDSSENLDSSESNVSCISDTSTMTTASSSSSLAANRLRRK